MTANTTLRTVAEQQGALDAVAWMDPKTGNGIKAGGHMAGNATWRRVYTTPLYSSPQPTLAVKGHHPLSIYADSYAQMGRMGDGKVDCRSVEVDIRQNMIPVTQALSSAPATADGWRMVPEYALDWLFGAGPDKNDQWFCDVPGKGAFWWRSQFKAMLPAAPTATGGR